MPDEFQILDDWLARGDEVAVATVVKTYGSAPRREGSKMLVNSRGEMQGSVSGGCVEGAVFEECSRTLKTGRPKLLKFGVADETAWEVGLACGGTIEIFVEKINW
ncbi:MAG: XdhC family protein [Chloroflexi bacterium]|nr:XdhC family protein [Chloroflexota bacterium]